MAGKSARKHADISAEGKRTALGAVSSPSLQGFRQRQETLLAGPLPSGGVLLGRERTQGS